MPSETAPTTAAGSPTVIPAEVAGEGWVVQPTADLDQVPHRASELEDRIPRDVTQPAMMTSSLDAGQWGDPLLKRALKRLGVDPKDCLVAIGIGGEGAGAMTATLYAVPGVAADDLEREFASAIHLPRRGHWEAREVTGKRVSGQPATRSMLRSGRSTGWSAMRPRRAQTASSGWSAVSPNHRRSPPLDSAVSTLRRVPCRPRDQDGRGSLAASCLISSGSAWVTSRR
jgi:hypothetical protein